MICSWHFSWPFDAAMGLKKKFFSYFFMSAFFWDYSSYSHSGLGITEYTEYQFPKECIFCKRNTSGGGDLRTIISAHVRVGIVAKFSTKYKCCNKHG